MLLPTASANDITFIGQHTTAVVGVLDPLLKQTKQVHAAAGPVNTVAPAVTGTVTIGQVQTCSTGTWLNSPAFTYQWRRRGKQDLAGATSATYTLVAADSGNQIECDVTGTNGDGVVSARSNAVSVP
jgi:hypothetical protein